jgi:fatty-acyl-CoA synthase
MTITELLLRTAERGLAEGLRFVALTEESTRIEWSELANRAQRVAGGLRGRGVVAGDTVAIVMTTGPAFFDAFFGILFAGAIPVPLYPPVRLGRLQEYHARTAAMLRAARVRLLVVEARVWRLLGHATALAAPELGCVDIADIDGPPLVAHRRPDDLALVQFSSGTTVDPKPVALTHANILANVDAILSLIVTELADGHNAPACVSWLPLYHDMGLIGCVFPSLRFPGSLHLIAPEVFLTRPALWLRTLSRTRALVSPAPNFAYSYCVERIKDEELEGVDLSGWSWALNGAEPVAPETLRRFADRFAPWGFRQEALTPVYGLSEASLAVTFARRGQGLSTRRFNREKLANGEAIEDPAGVELVSVGRALTGMAVEAPTGTVGPVRVSGPSIMAGYLHRPEATAVALKDGWLDTGDQGFFHDEELYLTGRAKDLIILRGRNHAPHEIEQAIDSVSGVRIGCAAAVGYRPEGSEQEEIVVFVEYLKDASPGDAAEIITGCQAAVLTRAGLQVNRIVLLLPGTLARTSSGKIRRGETLRQWLSGELVPPTAVNAITMVGALASGTLAQWRAARKG